VQQTFNVYREEVFNKSVPSVERNGYHITTRIEYRLDKEQIFVSFRGEFCVDQADKQAMLSFFVRADAVAYMHELVKTLLRGG
jgi:hypothetical protein